MNPPLQPVSVIIVNYNAGELLGDCVRAALAQAEQVIVVDNYSSDSSLTGLASLAGEGRLLIHRSQRNRGFAAGCNLGLNLAAQPNLLFLNPDCILEPDSLRRLVQVLADDSSIGMVGGRLTNLDGSEQGGGRRAVPTPWR
ncbi:MAG: glycosyltransferase, partial [Desulfobulbaceae bacterium]|nr:glycosyltransferase [Desulfobulbaceae bacterium]